MDDGPVSVLWAAYDLALGAETLTLHLALERLRHADEVELFLVFHRGCFFLYNEVPR